MARKLSKYSDSDLVGELKKTKAKSEAAFSELYARHSQRIYAYCLRVTGDEEQAKDIFQEAFFKFFNAAKESEKIGNVPGFLITITRNLCLNYKRDKKVNLDIDDFQFSAGDPGYEQKEMLDILARALEMLSDEDREIFVLRLYQGFSHKEISEMTGASVAAVKNRIWRAKEKVKDILSPYLEDLN
jgi:RNA polymerase sigma-70 factor (ECF subfamily)